jgi:hypothetical protein
MGRGILYFIFQRPRFCCCLPVRVCVVAMSLLGILLSGVLSVILWFEVSRAYPFSFLLPSFVLKVLVGCSIQGTDAFTSKQRAAFAGGAIVATLLFLISIVGYVRGIQTLSQKSLTCKCASLIGAIVRKLTFVTAYAVGLYVHFVINFVVAMYLLFVILRATRKDTVTLCEQVLRNAQSQGQCDSLFSAIRGLYAGLASFILVVELCEYTVILTHRHVHSHPSTRKPKKYDN